MIEVPPRREAHNRRRLTVDRDHAPAAADELRGVASGSGAEIDGQARVAGESDVAVLFVHGVGMRPHTGVARKMFGALASRGINIAMINTSEVCVSVVVEAARGEEALECLRSAFGL